MTIFSHKVGPIGNRHIKDHILCNFHAIHPYLIHVANFVNVVIIDGSSYIVINEGRFNPVLA